MQSANQPVNVPFFKKPKARPSQRKRSASPGPSTESLTVSEKSQVVLPTKKPLSSLLSAGTKRKAADPDSLDDDRDGPDVKWAADSSHIDAARQILAADELDQLIAKRRRKDDDELPDDDLPDDGQYRGMNAYKSHLQKKKEIPKAMRVGPQQSSSTIRTVTIVDYQPDVCKDYKGLSSLLFSAFSVLTFPGRNRLLWFR
jgi:RING finger protein 113A